MEVLRRDSRGQDRRRGRGLGRTPEETTVQDDGVVAPSLFRGKGNQKWTNPVKIDVTWNTRGERGAPLFSREDRP